MIVKISFRDQVRQLLIDSMISGKLRPGDNLSLASLSRDLNVSVTPIREALTQLEHSKLIKSIPNRGFIIPALSDKEARNLYELIASIESLAIEKSNFDKKTILSLKKQQAVFKTADNIVDRINADLGFHKILTSCYDNETAQQMISDIKTRIFFYELYFMTDKRFHYASENQHENIISALENHDRDIAIVLLKKNWLQILEFLNNIK